MTGTRIRAALMTGLLTCTMLLAPTGQGTADAVFAGANGRLAFAVAPAQVEGSDIWTANPDGTGLRQVTRNGLSSGPRWAPSGRLIAHMRHTIRQSTGELWTIRPNGTEARRVSTGVSAGQVPAWSPRGDELLAVRPIGNGSDLFRVPLAGGRGQRLTFSAARGCGVAHPSWRRNLIVYARYCPDTQQLRLLNVDTRRNRLVIGGPPGQTRIEWPDFTADMRIMFMSCGLDATDLPCPFGVDVTVINRDGTGLTSLTETCGCQGDVYLSESVPAPGGSAFAYISFDPGDVGDGTNSLKVAGVSETAYICCGGQFGDPTPFSPDWQRLPR